MKKEYDFTNAQQGRFCIPIDEIEAPIYLEKDVASFFTEKLRGRNVTLPSLINELLRKDIEIVNRISA